MYEFIRNTGGWDNWCVVVLETACCVDRQEAINLEQKYMSEHDHILNNNKAILCRSCEQQTIDEKEYQKRYRANPKNNERQKELQRKYRLIKT